MDEQKDLSVSNENVLDNNNSSVNDEVPNVEENAGTSNGNDDVNKAGNGYRGLASSNREAFSRGLSDNYNERIARNKARVNESKANAANSKKEVETDNGVEEKDKTKLDKVKDKADVLKNKGELAASKIDKARSGMYAVTNPKEAAKMVIKAKIRAWILASIVPITIALMSLFVLFVSVLFVLGLFEGGNSSIGSTTGASCSYNVNGQSVENVKVRLLNCAGYEILTNEELIDFETYIVGVLYQEVGNVSYEALKAQAVAARSYALTRPSRMGNAYGLNLAEENGQWILSLRSCTNDQVFCNPNKGCWSNERGGQTSNSNPGNWSNCTVYSGYDPSKNWTKNILAEDSNIRKAVDETKGQVLVDNNGNIMSTGFVSSTQEEWVSLANNGYDYFEILMNTYGSSGASKILTPNCEFSNINTNIDNVGVVQMINATQSEAWNYLIGRSTNERAPYVSKNEIGSRMVTISVPYRAWSGSGKNPVRDTVKKEAKITVNAALADLWLAFFTDVYNEATDFVIGSFDGCYNYRNVTGGGSLSAHAYGVACDINASTAGNGYNVRSLTRSEWEKLPETRSKYQVIYQGSKVVQIAHKYTLINGSDWRNPNDSMHFSFIVDVDRAFAQGCQNKAVC